MKIEINKLSKGKYIFLLESDDYNDIKMAQEFISEMIIK